MHTMKWYQRIYVSSSRDIMPLEYDDMVHLDELKMKDINRPIHAALREWNKVPLFIRKGVTLQRLIILKHT